MWLQLRRHGREMFEVTGLDDVDQGWLRAVRKQAKGLRIVPRLRFEDWTYEDFDSVLDNEDEIEELSRTVVQVAKSQHFDGLVVEVWNQLLVQKHAGLIHLLTHMAEALHQARLLVFLVIPPAVAPGTNKLGMFTNTEFEQLAPVLDGFSLMTYDYSTAQPAGPNAPLPWCEPASRSWTPSPSGGARSCWGSTSTAWTTRPPRMPVSPSSGPGTSRH